MDAHEDTLRIQVLSVSDTGRRHRWSDNEKIRIVEESISDGVTLAEDARRHCTAPCKLDHLELEFLAATFLAERRSGSGESIQVHGRAESVYGKAGQRWHDGG